MIAENQHLALSGLEKMIHRFMPIIHCKSGYVFLASEDQEHFSPVIAIEAEPVNRQAVFYAQHPEPTTDVLLYALLHGAESIIHSQQVQPFPLGPSITEHLGIRSYAAALIKAEDRLLGLLLLGDFDDDMQPEDHCIHDLIYIMTDAMTIALDNAHLYRETHNRLMEIQSLHQVTLALLQNLALGEVLELVCRESQKFTQANGSSVSLVEDESSLRIAFRSGEASTTPRHTPVNDSPFGSVIRHGKTLLINDQWVENQSTGEKHPGSLLAAPLRANGEIIGVLCVINKPGGFTQGDARMINLFADQVAVAIWNARLHQQVERIAVLEERQRLARDLHDSVNQLLYGILLHTEVTSRHLTGGRLDDVRSDLQYLRQIAKDALAEMRLFIFDLRPPVLKEKGLAAALEERLKTVEERAGIECGMKVRLNTPLSQDVEEELYRLTLEALNNVVKHSHAKKLTIHLIQSGTILILRIEDDGDGFDIEKAKKSGGLGLKTMAERAAAIGALLSLESHPGAGTTIFVEAKL